MYSKCDIDISNCDGKDLVTEYNNLLELFDLDIEYNNINKIQSSLDESDLRKMFNKLEIMYNMNTYYLAYYYMSYRKLIEFYNKQCKEKGKLNVTLTLFENLDYTQRKKIELNLIEYDKIKNYNYSLKIILLFVGILIIVPILLRARIFNKSLAVIIWFLGIVIAIIIAIFMIFIKAPVADNTYYEILNQPTKKTFEEQEILEMGESKKEKKKCSKWKSVRGDFDMSNTNIVEMKKKCDNLEEYEAEVDLSNEVDYGLLDECKIQGKCVKEKTCTNPVNCTQLELLKKNLGYDEEKMYNEIKSCDKWDSIKHIFYPTTSVCNSSTSSSSIPTTT